MLQIPPNAAEQIDRLFSYSQVAAQRDDAITREAGYPPLLSPLEEAGTQDIHTPIEASLRRATCPYCMKEKASRWFYGIVFRRAIYCEPCHYREAGSLTIQSAMGRS